MERCENCERTIGNLETPYVWGERAVCADCYRRLTAEGDRSATAIVVPVAYATPLTDHPGKVQVIEQTSKIYKGQILIASTLFAGGVLAAGSPFLWARPMAGHGPWLIIFGMSVAGIAAVWLAVVRCLIWWNHA